MKCRILVALIVAALCATAAAQTPPAASTAPAATQPAGTPLVVTVKEVTGSAQRTTVAPNAPPNLTPTWVALQVGDKLGENTLIRTGFRTRVVLAMADNSEVVIDRATKLGIGQFRKVGQVTCTQLGMKYGSIRASVEKARGPNDFRVATPVSVFAVTGTGGTMAYTGDFGFALDGDHGSWATRCGARHRGTRGTEDVNTTFVRNIYLVQAAYQPFLGPVGLSRSEQRSLFFLGGGRGIIGFDGAGQGARVLLRRPPPCSGSSGSNGIVIDEEGMYKAR
ncbi:MAG TPA: FecR domain-containing protein [Phycisphaerae bacterium]|nr:FecR domain-containing protein [Phycisphaerae bacterium]